jgi:hypothetical protein
LIVNVIRATWAPGRLTMSTLPVETLLAVKRRAGLHLCQEFVVHNPSRLPTPIQKVNVKRSWVKNS